MVKNSIEKGDVLIGWKSHRSDLPLCLFPDLWEKLTLWALWHFTRKMSQYGVFFWSVFSRIWTEYHETIMQTGIGCNKISYYMRKWACRCLIVANTKTFQSHVNFWIFPLERNCGIFNHFHNILRLFDVSPQVKRCAIITYTHGI